MKLFTRNVFSIDKGCGFYYNNFVVVPMKQTNIERFYDYYNNVATLLYETYKKPYIEGMNEAFNLLLDDTLKGEYEETDISTLLSYKKEIVDVSFEREEVRKAVQLGMLKGYKHTFASNALITPDTIGIFFAYLIQKLYKKNIESIFDPMVGSGNLLFTVANHLEGSPTLYGVDNDVIKCELARNLGDLLDHHHEIYYQDTVTFFHPPFDVVMTDVPLCEGVPYTPYQYINHHIIHVKEGGFFLALIENDFFEQEQSDIFRTEIMKEAHIYGLIKLSETMFKSNPKSILLLRRKGPNIKPIKDFLLVDLPSFTDSEALQKTVQQIDTWIVTREDEIL
jgi:site-specific DNA-methyltransferase (adenine-specific)